MSINEERMRILERIESGEISADEGLGLLQNLIGEPEEGALPQPELSTVSASEAVLPFDAQPLITSAPIDQGEREQVNLSPAVSETGAETSESFPTEEAGMNGWTHPGSSVPPPQIRKWRNWWMIPLWVGVGLTVLGGYLMFLATSSSSTGWLLCASIPFAMGVLLTLLAWQSKNAPWLHIRVNEEDEGSQKRVAISFPIPIKPTVWFLHTFQDKIPNLKETSLDEILLAVGETTSPENPIYIQVDEGEKGEHVEIYVG